MFADPRLRDCVTPAGEPEITGDQSDVPPDDLAVLVSLSLTGGLRPLSDPNWPDWYAEYMVREQAGIELPQ